MNNDADTSLVLVTQVEEVINELTDIWNSDELESIIDGDGVPVAAAYCVGANCVDVLGEAKSDDWLLELIRHAYSKLSSEGQLKLADSGF